MDRVGRLSFNIRTNTDVISHKIASFSTLLFSLRVQTDFDVSSGKGAVVHGAHRGHEGARSVTVRLTRGDDRSERLREESVRVCGDVVVSVYVEDATRVRLVLKRHLFLLDVLYVKV